MVDQAIKILEVPREYAYKIPIPVLREELHARITNIQNSRIRAEKFNEIDDFVKQDYYGLRAVTTLLNSLFGGGSGKGDKPKGASNMSGVR